MFFDNFCLDQTACWTRWPMPLIQEVNRAISDPKFIPGHVRIFVNGWAFLAKAVDASHQVIHTLTHRGQKGFAALRKI
ncbi:hypothetical protein [uncultured Tateyamaria sp.]|uniref:hypothetical protein n=1 Tax=uncultured Tateyamaria sp. TaxID=455651 RepID=UPI00262F2F2B|nr:hypothetical protein [uncultured Tateyamaria sp.]